MPLADRFDGDQGGGRFGFNNRAAQRRELVNGGDLLADRSVPAKKLARDAFPKDIKGTSADLREPAYHPDSDAVAQEEGGPKDDVWGFARATHNHDRTYAHEIQTTDKAADDGDYVAGATSVTDAYFDPGGGVTPDYQLRVVSWDLVAGLQPSVQLVYARYSRDAGATFSRWERIGRTPPGENQYWYRAEDRWNFDPAASPAVTAQYRVEFTNHYPSAALKLVRTGTDGKIDSAFLASGAAGWYFGAGSPEGAVTAAVGSGYRDTTNGTIYVKRSGSGNTGWRLVYSVDGTDVAIADGGTGASTAADARTNLGVGTGDSPQFTGVNFGHATDTTVTRDAAGDIAVEGNRVYRAGGTDVPVADGGTGASSAAGARTNLGLGTMAVEAAADYTRKDGTVAFTGDQSMGGNKVTSVGTPTADADAANKAYVDSLLRGLDWKNSVRVATTAAGTLASDFENGDTVDGVVLATGDRILIKNQASGAENGIYTVNASGAPTRATDADVSDEVTAGMAVFVAAGTTNADTCWLLTTNDPITLGTTALVFTQFGSGGGGAPTDAQYVALAANGSLSQERVLTAGAGVAVADGGAGAAVTLSLDVPGLTQEATLDRVNDEVPFYDNSAAAPRRVPMRDLATAVVSRVASDVDVVSSSSETTIFSLSVPGGMLSTNRALRLLLYVDYLNNTAGTSTLTLRVKYGATTLYAATTGGVAQSSNRRAGALEVTLAANNATNAQNTWGTFTLGNATAPTTGIGALAAGTIPTAPFAGSSAEDSTAAKTFSVTIQHSVNSASVSFRVRYAALELV